MTELKRVIHCGIDFNLMESGDKEYREECLKYWLAKNCTGNYRYDWSFGDEFTIHFDEAKDYENSAVLAEGGIPRKD